MAVTLQFTTRLSRGEKKRQLDSVKECRYYATTDTFWVTFESLASCVNQRGRAHPLGRIMWLHGNFFPGRVTGGNRRESIIVRVLLTALEPRLGCFPQIIQLSKSYRFLLVNPICLRFMSVARGINRAHVNPLFGLGVYI